MLYRIVTAKINNDGSVTEGKARLFYQTPAELNVGGLYFLRPGKLYRVVEIVHT